MPTTPSNTHAVYHMYQQAFAEFDATQQPKLLAFIDTLVNAAGGGLTEGFLGQDCIIQLEAVLKAKADDLKDARRHTKVTAARAITGADLLTKMRDLVLNLPKTPKKCLAPSKTVTFSKQPKPQRHHTPSPATIDLSSTSSTSGRSSAFESESEGSTIYLMTPGTIQTTLCPSIHHTHTPATPGLSTSGSSTPGRHSRVLRPRT